MSPLRQQCPFQSRISLDWAHKHHCDGRSFYTTGHFRSLLTETSKVSFDNLSLHFFDPPIPIPNQKLLWQGIFVVVMNCVMLPSSFCGAVGNKHNATHPGDHYDLYGRKKLMGWTISFWGLVRRRLRSEIALDV